MASIEFIRACRNATKALTEVGNIVREKDGELDGAEQISLYVLLLSFRYVMNPLQDDDGDDENPYRYDDDHTFT